MRVDLRRADVRVTQRFLHRANVLAGLQQMRREAVPQCVARRRLGHAGAPHGGPDRTLQHGFVQVMTAFDAAARIDAAHARWKYVLPHPFTRGVRILAIQCMRQPHGAEAGRKITLVQATCMRKLSLQRINHHCRQHRATVLAALALPHRDLTSPEIDILHSQPQALHQA